MSGSGREVDNHTTLLIGGPERRLSNEALGVVERLVDRVGNHRVDNESLRGAVKSARAREGRSKIKTKRTPVVLTASILVKSSIESARSFDHSRLTAIPVHQTPISSASFALPRRAAHQRSARRP